MRVAWLAREARALMETDGLKWSPRETGGPLFGYDNHGELVITRAYPPGPRAFHAPWLYRPDRDSVQAAIDDVYEATVGRERWVGSWHTHPLGRALPSVVDRHTAGRVAAEDLVACPEPVMLIQTTRVAGRRQRPGPLGAFRYARARGRLERVEVRAYRGSSGRQ